MFGLVAALLSSTVLAQAPVKIGTHLTVGARDGLTVEVAAQGPSTQPGPLQVACLFEYVEGDLTTSPPALPATVNGMLHLDQALQGLVTDLRRSGRFSGRALETLLLTPRKGVVKAQRILLVGLGDRRRFKPALMKEVGKLGMREALRLGLTEYAQASDLKDAGINASVREVTQAVVSGALAALETERYLMEKGAAAAPSVRTMTLVAGPAFFAETSAAARELLPAGG